VGEGDLSIGRHDQQSTSKTEITQVCVISEALVPAGRSGSARAGPHSLRRHPPRAPKATANPASDLYTLAGGGRGARAVEQPGAWLRLQDERWAARRCIRAATALVVAVRERDTARLRASLAVFRAAHRAYEGFSS